VFQHPTFQTIAAVQSTLAQAFRAFLLDRAFTEIHTPKLVRTEAPQPVWHSQAVTRVTYFEQVASLAVGSTFYKQAAIAADFERVFEVCVGLNVHGGQTAFDLPREYTRLELEMEIFEHYHEVRCEGASRA